MGEIVSGYEGEQSHLRQAMSDLVDQYGHQHVAATLEELQRKAGQEFRQSDLYLQVTSIFPDAEITPYGSQINVHLGSVAQHNPQDIFGDAAEKIEHNTLFANVRRAYPSVYADLAQPANGLERLNLIISAA